MVTFTNFVPMPNQVDVTKTTIVNFTIIDAYTTAQIYSLNVFVNSSQVIQDGYFINGYTGNIFPSVGKFVVGVYPKAPFLPSGSEIPVQIEIIDGSVLDSYSYKFYTYNYIPVPPLPPDSVINRSCDKTKPFFPPTDLGLVIASDTGTGSEINLSWKTAYPYNQGDVIFYNLYYSTSRDSVFDGYPDFLVTDTQATIWGLTPGETHFFGVRVCEFSANIFTYSGMQQAGMSMYFYPTMVETDGYTTVAGMVINADSISGFPDYGIIQIDSELIKYRSLQISPPAFIVGVSGRGYGNTIAASHNTGSKIKLYGGQEDANTIIASSNATFEKPNYALTHVLGDGYGPDGYRDGYDGYASHDGYLRFKQEEINSITSPGTQNDNSGEFPRFDYCGTWRALSPQSFMKGQCTPSYFGGVQIRTDSEGTRHLVKITDVQTHMLQREEQLIETTGEPMILVRRMWTGMRCHCFMLRREHPDARCPTCFNTGFVQGYVEFFDPRRSDRRIMVRVDPATDDLNIVDRGGFEPVYEPDGWTLPFPQIKDRDILVRFVEDTLEEWRYEVLNVTRNKTLFSQVGVQRLKLKRIPKTDIIYTFPIIRNCAPYPTIITTSVNSTPGILAHSHEIKVPTGVNLVTLKTATLEAERHNHIIYNGIVQNVLNHAHIIV